MASKKAHAPFLEYLKRKGLKVTKQRMAIVDAVLGIEDHFSAEDLHKTLRKSAHAASLATVYRTVSVLVEGGFLEALDIGGGQLLYEHVLGAKHHDHLVCLGCRRIEEFHCEEIERAQDREAEQRGFHVTHHSLRIFGYCAECRAEGRDVEEANAQRLAASRNA